MLLELKDIHKSYFKGDGQVTRKVLDGLDLSMEAGDCISIVGPSGSGKTTLLNLISALDKPDTGMIKIDQQDLLLLKGHQLDQYRNQSIGIVFQLHHLMPQLTLFENVMLPTMGSSSKEIDQAISRAEDHLKKLDIWEQRSQKPGELSGGECQRAAVARALINQPRLIIADEPTGALDEDNARTMADLLLEIHKETGTALIIVTHSPELAARANRQFLLKKGKLIEA
jgi:lipoprotein-releasing system ATP-binding protein